MGRAPRRRARSAARLSSVVAARLATKAACEPSAPAAWASEAVGDQGPTVRPVIRAATVAPGVAPISATVKGSVRPRPSLSTGMRRRLPFGGEMNVAGPPRRLYATGRRAPLPGRGHRSPTGQRAHARSPIAGLRISCYSCLSSRRLLASSLHTGYSSNAWAVIQMDRYGELSDGFCRALESYINRLYGSFRGLGLLTDFRDKKTNNISRWGRLLSDRNTALNAARRGGTVEVVRQRRGTTEICPRNDLIIDQDGSCHYPDFASFRASR